MDKKIIRRRYRFYGSVQGVGFRYRAKHAADMYRVTGWVHNCYDGTVEMEAEGPEESLDMVIQTLRNARFIFIDRIEVKEIPIEDSRSFGVR